MHVCNIHSVFFSLLSQFETAPTLVHVLSDDIDGLFGHHGVQLHQLVVPELLHDLSFFQEGLGRHGAGLQSLDSYLSGAVPRAWQQKRKKGLFKDVSAEVKEWKFGRILRYSPIVVQHSKIHENTVIYLKSTKIKASIIYKNS